MKEPIHINAFCCQCGFFNSGTIVNNSYGCDHPEQSEWEYVKANDPEKYADSGKVKLALLRKRFGSYHSIKYQIKKAGDFLNTAMYDPKLLAEINVKMQGKCYAFSCPKASRMEAEDWEERGENPESYDQDWVLPHQNEAETII